MSTKKITGYTIFLNQILGKGAYGSVYRGEKDGTKDNLAIKVINKQQIASDEYMKNAIISEINVLKTVKSENIVGFQEVMESSQNYYIIQQLCDSDLQKLLSQTDIGFSEQKSLKILTQLCNGFIALIREGIIHRDLKPANILLKEGVVKIGDFGFAKKNYSMRVRNSTTVGTPLYMPVEILKGLSYTSKCDIWSLGCIFYQMLHGCTPWIACTQFQLIQKIEKVPLRINNQLHEDFQDFLRKCLAVNEKQRFSWDQLLTHPIFNGFFASFSQKNKQFENKMKKIMSDIRYMVNAQNIDMLKLFDTLGLNNNQQLCFQKFSKILKLVNPEISEQEQIFIFEKLDLDNSGTVSLEQLKSQMKKNFVNFNAPFQEEIIAIKQNDIGVNKQNSDSIQPAYDLSLKLKKKVNRCFKKLYKALTNKNITLFRAFMAFDSDKSGQLSITQFQNVIRKLDPKFTIEDDEISLLFQYLDTDKSGTVQFDEINSYYCKINSIPYVLDLPPQYHFNKLQKIGKTSNKNNKNPLKQANGANQ